MRDVIVIGANYATALGVIRSLGEGGYGVRFIGRHKETINIAGKSKYVTKCAEIEDNSFSSLFKALESLRGNKDHILVIPTNDGLCQVLDEHVEDISEHYVIPNIGNKNYALTRYMDKMVQKEMAAQCGLRVAQGTCFSTDNQNAYAEMDISFPCFVKPIASANVIGCKRLFAVCNNFEELNNAIKATSGKNCKKVLVEEYLSIDEELCVYGVACQGNVYAPACVKTFRGGFAEHKGVTAEGQVIPASQLGETTDQIVELVKKIGLTGLFCVDILRCGSELYFSEINLRFGGSGYAVTLAGANLSAALADLVYNQSLDRSLQVSKEVVFLNERIEFDAFIKGHITMHEYKEHMAGNQERFVFDSTDVKPWHAFRKMVFINKIKYRVKKLLRRI